MLSIRLVSVHHIPWVCCMIHVSFYDFSLGYQVVRTAREFKLWNQWSLCNMSLTAQSFLVGLAQKNALMSVLAFFLFCKEKNIFNKFNFLNKFYWHVIKKCVYLRYLIVECRGNVILLFTVTLLCSSLFIVEVWM